MKIETKLIFNKYLRLMYILTYRKPAIIFISFIGAMVLYNSIFYYLEQKGPFWDSPILLLVFGLFIVVFLPFSVYRNSKNNFLSNNRLQEKIQYEFLENGIKITGESFSSELNWEKTYKVLELKDWILIYQDKLVANVIPKESFGNRLEEFKLLVKEKKVKASFKK